MKLKTFVLLKSAEYDVVLISHKHKKRFKMMLPLSFIHFQNSGCQGEDPLLSTSHLHIAKYDVINVFYVPFNAVTG